MWASLPPFFFFFFFFFLPFLLFFPIHNVQVKQVVYAW